MFNQQTCTAPIIVQAELKLCFKNPLKVKLTAGASSSPKVHRPTQKMPGMPEYQSTPGIHSFHHKSTCYIVTLRCASGYLGIAMKKKSPALLAVYRMSAVRCYILYYEVYICKLSSNPGNVVL